MLKLNPILLSVLVLLIASLACYVPGTTPIPDQDLLGTMVAQTVAAGQTQSAPTVTPISIVTATPTFTFTPTLSPTPTLTFTPVFTSTPLIPLISVSVPTNCRVGPGKVFERVGALLVGEVAEVVGRDPTGNYWYIRNPDASGDFCWLWGEYATLTGNFAALPMFTPPPTPTPEPAFDLSYNGKDTCSGWWVDLEVENTGGITFRSISITVKDTVLGTTLNSSTDGFTEKSGCSGTVTKDTLSPGDTRIVSSPAFDYDPAGNKIRATVTLCSNKGLNGMCVTDTITFTP
jgi:hypothetical protein